MQAFLTNEAIRSLDQDLHKTYSVHLRHSKCRVYV